MDRLNISRSISIALIFTDDAELRLWHGMVDWRLADAHAAGTHWPRTHRRTAPAYRNEIDNALASDYTAELSLHEMITPEAIARYLPENGRKVSGHSAKGLVTGVDA